MKPTPRGTLALDAVQYLNRKGDHDSFEKDVRDLIAERDALLEALEAVMPLARKAVHRWQAVHAFDSPMTHPETAGHEDGLLATMQVAEAAIAAARGQS